MATDTETFEDVDWESQDVSTLAISRQGLAELGAYLAILLTFVYDHWILKNEGPTIGNWDILSVEWLFMATMVALFFHLALPMYQNPRLRRFYWKRFKQNRVAVLALVYLLIIFAIGIVGPLVMEPPTTRFKPRLRGQPPFWMNAKVDGVMRQGSMRFPLGTTMQGTGLLKLIVYGMRVSMEVGLIATVFTILIGSVVGGTAALATSLNLGWMDEALMRYVDLQATFPTFVLLLLLVYLFGGQLWMIILLYGFFSWEGVARTVRGEALQRAAEDYVTAARSSGANMMYVLRQHLLPNSANSIIISGTIAIPGFILGEATLAFLGFSDPDTYSWGRTIANGQGALADAWWIATIPGIFLFFTVLSFYYVGEALRDAMDPRQQVGQGGSGL